MLDVSDCIAMSDDGDWYAFPAGWTRGQVIGALAEDSSWWDVLHGFALRKGSVHLVTEVPPDVRGWLDWWEECEADAVGATAAWIVTRR